MPPGTMRGFTVLCMQSSPFAQGTYVQSMGIHSLRRTIHGLSRSILCARYNPWIACAIHRLLRNLWIHRLRRTIVGVVWAWLSRRPALALTIENRLSAIKKSAIENRQSTIENRKSAIENRQSNRQSKIENRLSKIDNRIDNRKSKIDNRKSKIDNPESTIENRKSKNRIYRLFRSKINER